MTEREGIVLFIIVEPNATWDGSEIDFTHQFRQDFSSVSSLDAIDQKTLSTELWVRLFWPKPGLLV